MLNAACISWPKSSFRFFCNILWKILKNFLVNPMYYFFSPPSPPPNHHEVGTIWAHLKDKGIKLCIKFAQLIHHFANKGLSSQSFVFSSSDVWMWELDQKEGWAPKNWCFVLWYWRRLLRVSWIARRSNQSILKKIGPEYWKDWCWSWSSSTVATWCEEPTDWKDPDAGKDWKGREEGDNRGWDGCMASPTHWTWVWASSKRWWKTGKPGVLQPMGSQRVRHNWVTKQQKTLFSTSERVHTSVYNLCWSTLQNRFRTLPPDADNTGQ